MAISKESINYSIRNLKKSKGRSSLTILSIFVGIATIFIFISYGLGLYNYIDEFTTSSSADKLLIQPEGTGAPGLGSAFPLTEEDLKAVEKTQGVYEATGNYFKVAEVRQNTALRYTYLMAYDPEKPLMLEFSNIDIIEGRGLKKGDTGKVVLGYSYMFDDKVLLKALKVNDRIEVQGKKLTIIGFFDKVGNPSDDANIYIVNEFIDDLYPDKNNTFGMIVARVDKDDISETSERVKKSLRKEKDLEPGKENFEVESFEEMLESFSGALDIVIGFIVLIAFISVIVSAVNTANTMITSVLERYKEIGVLKSIGAKNSEIFTIFLFESGVLGLIAGVIGVVVGWGASEIGAKILDNLGYGFLTPHYSWFFVGDLFVYCIVFAIFTGAISGVIPAINASKINTVDALRYE